MDLWQLISLDLPPLLAAVFCGAACALLGNYLLLSKQSLMGDAISHSVLPGIVAAFLITSSRATIPVFIGAAIAGILSAVMIEALRRYGRVESGAAMGVIFSIFFAMGVLLIEQAAARSVDLDADCLLHGQLESIFWNPPHDLYSLLSFRTLSLLPSEVFTSLITFLLVLAFVLLLYKELKISTFDPELASSLGFSSKLLHTLLMVFVAAAVVAAFKVVGSILVIAMIICPAAAARMFTDRLSSQLKLSVVFAVSCSFAGYALGAFGPLWLGFKNSVNAAGMISVVLGGALALSVTFAPYHGALARMVRRLKLALNVRREDILALLYRARELSPNHRRVAAGTITDIFGADLITRAALRSLGARNLIEVGAEGASLTESGARSAKDLVRTHRLWESYLVSKLGLPPDHVHQTAERLEHFTGAKLQEEVAQTAGAPTKDPHGREIPD